MTAGELRGLELLEADALYLARLLERTMVRDAQEVAAGSGDGQIVDEVRQLQVGLRRIRDFAKQAQRKAVQT